MRKISKLQVTALSALIAVTLAISAILAQSSNEQTNTQKPGDGKGAFGWHGGRHGRGMRFAMFRALNLTDEQKAQMKQIRQRFRAKRAEHEAKQAQQQSQSQ